MPQAGERLTRKGDKERMSDRDHHEQLIRAAATNADNPPDETMRVTSLKPSHNGFSQRRLLNVVSIVVASIVLLALAIHWLPEIIPARVSPMPTGTLLRVKTPTPTSIPRGTGWMSNGPGWAQDIAFSANGALGYTCGTPGPGATAINFAVYEPAQNVWKRMPSISKGEQCRISVSPSDARDVTLVTYDCIACNVVTSSSRALRSLDGGVTWSPIYVPGSLVVSDVAQTNSALFVVAVGATAPDNSIPTHLYVSRSDGPLTEISAWQLFGHSTQLISAQLISSESTIYANLVEAPCSDECLTTVRSSDEGRDWTRITPYQHAEIGQAAAQVGADTLVIWARPNQSSSQPPPPIVSRSTDKGLHWQELPALPSADVFFAVVHLSVLPDNSIFLWSIGPANLVYVLRDGATAWQRVAIMPTGSPLTIQNNAAGHAVALWGQAHDKNAGDFSPGLEYYPLAS